MFKQPPTPPLEDDFEQQACDIGLELLQSSAYHTPDDSPITPSMSKSSRESSKRVGFTLLSNNSSKNAKGTRKLEDSKPRRSILKQTVFSSDPITSDPVREPEDKSFPEMLEQMIRGLASDNVSARYDAYMSINGSLKAYDDMPSKESLAEKMSVLDGYLRRDLATECSNGMRESQMVTEALRFVTQLCHFQQTRSVMTAGLQTFLLNHSITILGKEDTSKSLVNLYLYFLSVQDFPSRVVNKEKVVRILAVLKSVRTRIQGTQCPAHRLAVYRRLIGQAKDAMATRASDWIPDMLDHLVSERAELRERAISLGHTAAQVYGSKQYAAVAEAIRRAMNASRTVSGDKTTAETQSLYIDDMLKRLHASLDDAEAATDVPVVWSIVILLLRSGPSLPGGWTHLPQWLKLIQACLNNRDSKIVNPANLAWIKFIYTIQLTDNTASSTSKLLFRPMLQQLERQARSKESSKTLSKNINATYLTLLYYGLRPGADFETLDRYWKEFIVPIFAREKGLLIEESSACQILISLFSSHLKVWQVNRALDTSTTISADELPRLECRWVRSRAAMIVDILRIYSPKLNIESDNEKESWKGVWVAFLDAIKLANTKEVKVSSETMQVMIALVQTYQQLLSYKQYSGAAWLLSYAHSQLGDLPFLEERVRQTDDPAVLEVVNASSTRSKASSPATVAALRLVITSFLQAFDSSDWAAANKESILKSETFTTTFSAATRLLQAGFKSLPVDVRHSATGIMQTRILDGMQQARSKSGSITTATVQQLLYFTRWLDKCLAGVPPSPAEDNDTSKIVEPVPVNEDTIVVAPVRPLPARAEKGKGKTPLIPTTKPVTPEPTARHKRGTILQQQPRLRHDNSQIEFASIDSSPSIMQAIESQMLTDRQKEVRERQTTDANALFKDISSSSGPKSRIENTPRLQLSGQDRSKIGSQRAGSSSPILPPIESLVAHRGSSESPSLRGMDPPSSRRTSMMHFSMDEPPSSPPQLAPQNIQDDLLAELASDGMGLDDDNAVEVIVVEGADGKEDVTPKLTLSQRIRSPEPVRTEKDDVAASAEPEVVAEESATPSEDEDNELVNSQIDQDIRRASQSAIVAESPRTLKTRKRISDVEEEADKPSKKARMEEIGKTDTGVDMDAITLLEAALEKAKSGMDAKSSLRILQMAAELTQIAAKAIQQ